MKAVPPESLLQGLDLRISGKDLLDDARELSVRGVEVLPALGLGKANAKHLALEAEIDVSLTPALAVSDADSGCGSAKLVAVPLVARLVEENFFQLPEPGFLEPDGAGSNLEPAQALAIAGSSRRTEVVALDAVRFGFGRNGDDGERLGAKVVLHSTGGRRRTIRTVAAGEGSQEDEERAPRALHVGLRGIG